jgi:uncharacterized protein
MNPWENRVQDAFNRKHLNLIILPTEACNFRCTYCYEDFDIGRMSPDIVQAVIKLMERRAPELRSMEISWFGGEPLLALPVVFAVMERGQELERVFEPFRFFANMTTNGYLLNSPLAERLAGLGVQVFQISLDGTAELHDRMRRRVDGAGTFDRIWMNLLAIRDANVDSTFILRIHFSPDTIFELDPLIDQINAQFGSCENFKVYFKAIERLGGSNDPNIALYTEPDEHFAKEVLDSRLVNPAQAFSFYGDDDGYVCYASKPNSLMIRADGRIGKCTVALRDARNTIGVIKSDGSLEIDQDLARLWMRGFENMDPGDLACPYTKLRTDLDPAIRAAGTVAVPLRLDPRLSSRLPS